MSTKNIVFIDERVSGYEALVGNLGTDTEWFLLDASLDGVAQMQRILVGYTNLDAIHVVSHGSTGALYLGSTALNGDNLATYQTPLKAIGSSFTETGDILLYGCNLAQGDVGISFVNSLAQIAGTDVAASDNVTGLGGDSVLEVQIGDVTTNSLYLNKYGAKLGYFSGTSGNDTLVGTIDNDTLLGGTGSDSIDGSGGDDWIEGGDQGLRTRLAY